MAVLDQVNGWHPSFQPSMDRLIAVTSSLTLSKDPRRMACWEMIPKNTSTRFSQDPWVGVKRSVTRGFVALSGDDRRWIDAPSNQLRCFVREAAVALYVG